MRLEVFALGTLQMYSLLLLLLGVAVGFGFRYLRHYDPHE